MKTSVLFVDDEPNLLASFRRRLRDQRDRWELHFASSGAEALDILAQQPIDVIVTDMRMPTMDGAYLLTEVRRRSPDTIRLVLSGQSEKEHMMRAALKAHQYLHKPCDIERLKNAIERACALRGQIADPALKKLISRLTKIPSVPSVYRQLVDELERSEPCLSRVAELVARDVAMITKLLHLVNSAFFGAPRRIQSPAHAVAMLGLDLLRPLVLSFGVFAQFHDERSSALSLSEIVNRSLQLSRLAARIVADLKPNDCRMMEDALLAGMIADVGLLVLASQKDLPYREMIESARGGTDRLYELERARWQVNHAGVGAYLLGLWGLPDQIVEAVAFHHEPQLCRSERPNALTAVHLADALLSETAVEQQDAALHSHFDETYVESLGLTARLPHWRRLAQQVVADPPVHAV